MSRVLAHALLVASTFLGGQPSGHAQVPSPGHGDEYPQADSQEATRVEAARRSILMASWLAEDPFHPAALDSIFDGPYLHHGMRHFARLADQSPATLAAAMRSLWQRIDRIVFDGEPYGYRDVVLAGLPRIRARLASLPRDEAAPIVHHVLLIEHELLRRSDDDWLETLARFIAEYRGTEASLLAAVDLITAEWVEIPQAVPRLEAFARSHPGTAAAAKAQYSIGFQLATRYVNPADARGGNHPLVRLQRVAELVKELESGRYPRCEWTMKAAQLMEDAGGWRLERANLPAEPADVTVVLNLYKDFVAAHVAGEYAWPPRRLAEFVVRIMGPVFERQGNRAGGVGAALTALEGMVSEPAHVRLARAEFYAAEGLRDGTVKSGELAAQARQVFESLAAETSGVVSRRALATLASQAFAARDYPRARTAFETYLARHPDSSWSWLAAIQLGETLEALGEAQAAADAYRHPAIVDAADPVVRTLAAARAAAALDRLDPAPSEARALLHRAKLNEALRLATPGHPQRDDAAAMQILDRLVNESGGFDVGAAAVARAALLHKAGRVDEARQAMSAALDRMVAIESSVSPGTLAASILEDVAAIEATLLRPVQGIPGLGTAHGLRIDTRPLPSVLMLIDRQVRLATGEDVTARVRRPYPGVRWVLHLTVDEYRMLQRVVETAGRNKPQSLYATLASAPDPDDGPPFWERFFPPSDRPLCDACPVIFDIEFVDAARTRALVRAAAGEGALTRLVMEKRDGQWRVVRVSDLVTISE